MLQSQIDDLTHQDKLLIIDHGINGEICFHLQLPGPGNNLRKVFCGKISRRARPHIQLLNAEIDGISTPLSCCCKRFIASGRSQ